MTFRRAMRSNLRALVTLLALALALAAPAGAQLGVDLVPDEKAPPKKKPAPPPSAPAKPPAQLGGKSRPPGGPVSVPELDLGARKGEAGKRIGEANAVFASGDFETAALAYDSILRDAGLAEVHDEARYQLAKSLIKLELYHSALGRLEELLSRGPQGTRYYQNALEWLFFVGGKTVNESVILPQVARYASGTFPPASQDRFNYVLARSWYERGRALDESGQASEAKKAYAEARRLAASVSQDAGSRPVKAQGEAAPADFGDVYAKSRFLDGLVRYAQGDGQGAVDTFKDVVRLTNPKRGRVPDPGVRELAFLQLARIHYEHKQNRYAIFYYDKMPWGGPDWLEGLWESSYAHYRIGNFEKALGNLLTLQSPYFKEEWFPESWILKAIIYYENCRYPEARAILDEFHATYEGVHGELERMTAARTKPAAFYDLIDDAQKGKGAAARPLMRRIMKLAFTDQSVKRLNDSILEVERELDGGLPRHREAFRSSALYRDLRDGLQRERGRMVEEAGARARAKLEYERDSLKDLLQQALRIKIEVARKERESLESALAHGGKADELKRYRYSVAVSDEHLYWPYDGEFWRDELGTYTYTLTKGCRDTGAAVSASR